MDSLCLVRAGRSPRGELDSALEWWDLASSEPGDVGLAMRRGRLRIRPKRVRTPGLFTNTHLILLPYSRRIDYSELVTWQPMAGGGPRSCCRPRCGTSQDSVRHRGSPASGIGNRRPDEGRQRERRETWRRHRPCPAPRADDIRETRTDHRHRQWIGRMRSVRPIS